VGARSMCLCGVSKWQSMSCPHGFLVTSHVEGLCFGAMVMMLPRLDMHVLPPTSNMAVKVPMLAGSCSAQIKAVDSTAGIGTVCVSSDAGLMFMCLP